MDDKETKILSEQVRQLYMQVPIALTGTAVNALIVSVIIWQVSNWKAVVIWLFSMTVLTGFRLADLRRYAKSTTAPNDPIRWRNRFVMYAFLAGIFWGSAALFFTSADTSLYQPFLAFVLGGMVAAALGVYSAYPPAFLAYCFPSLIPILVIFFSAQDKLHVAMGSMVLLFSILMISTARRLGRILITRIGLQLENTSLIDKLTQEIDERKAAQMALEKNKTEIEDRIEQRTAELKTLNTQLSSEIGERKLIARAMTESEEKYRELVENINDVIYAADEQGMVTFISPTIERLLGYLPDDLIGKALTNLVYPADIPVVRSGYQLLKSHTVEPLEYRMVARNGSIRWVRSSDRPMFEAGRLVRVRGLLSDITETKNLETQLHEAKKMEAIGRVAGGVAHDLNNILSGIVSYPELLLMDLPGDHRLRRPLEIIQKSGQKAADIVQDLLTLSRRGVSVKEVVNLNGLIDEYLSSHEYAVLVARQPHAQFKTDLSADLLNINGSPVQLSKTIMNLVANAIEAMPAGGLLSIRTENRYVDLAPKHQNTQEGDYAVLVVSDTGIGMSSEVRERIFEPFFSKKSMGRSGSGLGMAVVWGTVTDHNGRIEVESSEGEGTTFTIHFPAIRDELPAKGPQPRIEDYLGHGEKILVVDDIAEQREIGTKLLSKLGYEVASVASGEEAIAHLRTHRVDLLVLDMIMPPGMDGLDTYRMALEIYPKQRAIIASGFSETKRVKQARQLGAGAYVQKPYTLEKLGIAVRSDLDKKP